MSISDNLKYNIDMGWDFFNSQKNKVKNKGMQHLFKKKIGIDNPGCEDWSKTYIESKEDLAIIPMSEESYFADLDMVIFPDSQKVLPLNGIRQSEFKEIEQLLNKIANDETNIIFAKGFEKETIIADIVFLCNRKIGRDLIKKVCEQSTPLTICINNDWKSTTSTFKQNNKSISYCEYFDAYVAKVPIGEREGYKFPVPPFLILAHELIHYIHSHEKNYQNNNDQKDDKYTNGEEKNTIEGFTKPLTDNIINPDKSEDDFSPFKYDHQFMSEFSEWKLHASFGLPIREDHGSGGEWYTTENFLETNRSGTSFAFEEAINYGAHLDVRYYLDSYSKYDKNFINTPMELRNRRPIEIAIHSENPSMIKLVLKYKPEINFKCKETGLSLSKLISQKNIEIKTKMILK